MSAASEPRPSLTLLDLSDRELLLVLHDCADGSGYADAREMAAQLDLRGDHPHRSVAVRLSWLKRYGAVEREHERDHTGNLRYHRDGKIKTTQRWGLTDLGLAMATGKLTKSQERTLNGLGDGGLLMAARHLSRRVKSAGEQTGKLLDREYRHGVGRRV